MTESLEWNSETGSDDLAAQLQEVAQLTDTGEVEQAFRRLLELEPEHSGDATLLCMLGTVAAHLELEGMSADYFRRCLAEAPADPTLLVRAGAGLLAAGDPEGESALRLAAISAPTYAPARLHYGRYLVRSGLEEQGMEELIVARGLEPEDATVRLEIATAHLIGGRTAEAAEELEVATSLDPDDPDIRLLFGLAIYRTGDVERAAEELHPLAEGLAGDGEVQLLLALTFARAGWEEEGWIALSRAEGADDRVDPAVVREVEEALEGGGEGVESLLDDFAITMLRDRIFRF